MTLETRLLLGLDDLLSVQFVCNKCGARVSRDPKTADRIPAICGQCNATWHVGDETAPAFHFVRALRSLREAQGTGFTLLLEIDVKSFVGWKSSRTVVTDA